MGVDSREGEKVEAAGAGAAKAQDRLAGPKPEQGEIGGSGSGSSPSQCDEPMGDTGSTSVNPSPRLPCRSVIDEEDERDAAEQAAIATIILQLSQQPPMAKRRRVRNPPGGAHAYHHETSGVKHGGGVGGDVDLRSSCSSGKATGGRAAAASRPASCPASQPPTPQPPPSTPAGGLPGIPSFANFPDPVRHPLPLHQMPPLPLLSLSEGMQGNTLPALLSNKDAVHTHLPPPPDGVFQQALASSGPSQPCLHPFPGALTSGTPTAGRTPSAGGGGSGEAWAGDQNGQGNGDGSPMSTPRDGESGEGGAGAAGGNRTTEVRRPYRCSKCGAEKKGHLCSAKLAANMMPATPVKRVDLAARLAARLHAGNGEGGEGMEEGRGALQPNDLSNLPFFRSFRAEEVYGDAVMNHPALASGLPVLMKCPPGAWAERLLAASRVAS